MLEETTAALDDNADVVAHPYSIHLVGPIE